MGTQIDWSRFMEQLEHQAQLNHEHFVPGYKAVPAYVLVPIEQQRRKPHWLESTLALAVAAVVLVSAGVSVGLVIALWLL